MLCYLDGSGEGLAGVLRAGNAGSNTVSDHTHVLQLALEQLDQQALQGEILVRADGAGASHALTRFCRDGRMRFSFGFDVDERVRDAIARRPNRRGYGRSASMAASASTPRSVRSPTASTSPGGPAGSRLIARRTLLKAGDQQSFADHDGYRLAVFLTDQPGSVPELDLCHRGHARVEDRIRSSTPETSTQKLTTKPLGRAVRHRKPSARRATVNPVMRSFSPHPLVARTVAWIASVCDPQRSLAVF